KAPGAALQGPPHRAHAARPGFRARRFRGRVAQTTVLAAARRCGAYTKLSFARQGGETRLTAPYFDVDQPARPGNQPLSPAARRQSRAVVSLGRGGAFARSRERQADPPLDRLFRLSLVPRNGA